MPVEAREYLIGDFAQIIGVSRDTLRFYEKKGVVTAKKKENGYRYYSESDFYRLMYVIYHRKMNSSLEEIEDLMNAPVTTEQMKRHLDRKLEEEETAMRYHRLAIARIKLMKRDFEQIEQNLNQCSVRSFPAAYVMEHGENLQEALKKWFSLASTVNGLDMTYFYSVYTYEQGKLANHGTKLLFYKKLEAETGIDGSCYPEMEERACIYTVIRTETPDIAPDEVEKLIQWGKERGLQTERSLYANYMTSGWETGRTIYWIELYLPLAR